MNAVDIDCEKHGKTQGVPVTRDLSTWMCRLCFEEACRGKTGCQVSIEQTEGGVPTMKVVSGNGERIQASYDAHRRDPPYCWRIGGEVTLEDGRCPECGWKASKRRSFQVNVTDYVGPGKWECEASSSMGGVLHFGFGDTPMHALEEWVKSVRADYEHLVARDLEKMTLNDRGQLERLREIVESSK
jgi:hypothetical protein